VTSSSPPTIAVVGAGIAGLAAAWELVKGADGADRAPVEVHLYEAGDRVGGKLWSADFAGRRVDLAADAFLARRPEATTLCHELGLTEDLVPVGASGASVWGRGHLRRLPAGLNLGVPTRWLPLFRSGILSPGEALRVARDLVRPHRGDQTAQADRSVGAIVDERLGRPVVERLVDPLVGGINAGRVDDLSAAVTFPQLLAASRQSGSLMRRLAGPPVGAEGTSPPQPGPLFWSLSGSTASLADSLAEALSRRGVTIHTSVSVRSIEPHPDGRSGTPQWQLALHRTDDSDQESADRSDDLPSLRADRVVLAVPAGEAAALVGPHAPEAAVLLDAIAYASVAVVTLSVPTDAIRAPLRGTGFLVPRASTIAGGPALITGCTYLARKWPHLARTDDELFRLSVGRSGDSRHRDLSDDELTASAFGELTELLDIRDVPLDSLVTRWDEAFPQYHVGHATSVERIDRAVAALGGVAVAGAAYGGVGIPACIGSGRTAARRMLDSLSPGSLSPGSGVPRSEASGDEPARPELGK
jgi:protoporphyrinogen/coproporphyrinogen III oxidase